MPTKVRGILGAIAIVLAAACGDSPAAPGPVTVDVFTPGNTFSPFSTRIAAGTVVRFNIFGDDHNVIFSQSVPGYPADVNVVRDMIVARTFSTKGTFAYSCTVHPGMTGEIVVQ